MYYPYLGIMPRSDASVYAADGARIIGDVSLEADVTIWFNTVLRGDLAPIRIGRRTNVQDGAIGHVNTDQPLIIDHDVSIGHGAIIHGCSISRGSLIGMGAIVLNGVSIGEFALIGAGSVVTENTIIPPYTLSFGTPARPVRELGEADLDRMQRTVDSYVQKGREYRNEIQRD